MEKCIKKEKLSQWLDAMRKDMLTGSRDAVKQCGFFISTSMCDDVKNLLDTQEWGAVYALLDDVLPPVPAECVQGLMEKIRDEVDMTKPKLSTPVEMGKNKLLEDVSFPYLGDEGEY